MGKIPWKHIYKQQRNVTEKKIVTQENVCISSRKLKENHIGVLKVWSLTYNDSNFNMIINCEILKHPTESFTKCQICDRD